MKRIFAGSIISFIPDSSKTAVVCEDLKHVMYEGAVYSLSSLADKLREKKNSPGPDYFQYNGKALNEIRAKIGF